MEILVGIVLALSVFGNWAQHNKIEKLEREVVQLETTAEQNYQAATEAKNANDTLVDSVAILENANSDCVQKLVEFTDSIDSYEEAERVRDIEVEQLRDQLAEHNSSPRLDVCVVPDYVDLGIE